MLTIEVSDKIKKNCPQFVGAALLVSVSNSLYNDGLWNEIEKYTQEYIGKFKIEDIKTNPVIQATREAYKKLGKDPNRYRPSAESLCRRIVRGIPLYKVNTLVDLINLVSIRTGFSIGGFDADKISGDKLILGVGETDEPYEAIGRGLLNIEGLPVYRDNVGGIGTPTSDNERTKLDLETTSLLAIFNGYGGKENLAEAVALMQSLLKKYTSSDDGEVWFF
ncbi:hypothetical protein D0T53_03745 [Dysgonomonas sp. 216]|uniref:B3/B4 domain-containing protein n=1 Tax=Dysgonomonas sp. 216 TaxID=2302934 RepID=UPI0013D3DAD4|nr:phenylalanine--tRNA ligase beta subunit-related protein [Dysgonomonas sp. 216]NDW18029.1 hypothetical protein [Dysgonomonas sp. 216]